MRQSYTPHLAQLFETQTSILDIDIGKSIDNAVRIHVYRPCLATMLQSGIDGRIQDRVCRDIKGALHLEAGTITLDVERNVLDNVRDVISANMENSLSSLP